MSLLRKLFRPHWQHPSASMRQKAILNGKVSQEHCVELARHDRSPAVRESAVQHLDSIDLLVELGDQESLRAYLAARLRELLPNLDPNPEITQDTLDRAMSLLDDPQAYHSLVESAPAVGVRLAALRHVDNPAALRDRVLNDKAIEVRQAALERIDSAELLAEIIKHRKGRDKSISRRATQRLRGIREGAQRREQCANLLADLQALDDGPRPLNTRTWRNVLDTWAELAHEANAEEKARFDRLSERLAARVEAQQQRHDADRAAHTERTALIERLRRLADQLANADPDDIAAARGELRTAWARAAPLLDPWAERRLRDEWAEAANALECRLVQSRQRVAIEKKIAALVAELEKQLQGGNITKQQLEDAEHRLGRFAAPLTSEKAPTDQALQHPKHLIQRMRQRLTEQEANRRALQSTLEAQIQTLEEALIQKALERATKAHRAAVSALRDLGKQPPPGVRKLTERLHRSEPELRELQAWRNWGNDLARTELIEAAQSLINADIDLEHRAQTLKDLRKRWKALGGSGRDVQKSWKVFDAACTAAYAPIEKRRVEETEIRAQNLHKREAVCRELEALTQETDWNEPDWRTIDKQLQGLRRRWRELGGVAREAWSEVRERYHQALHELDHHLVNERRHNFRVRQSLVQAATALATQDDPRVAATEARKLREAWQVTVTSKPSEERRLWQAFNDALDEVFARERTAREGFKADLEEHQRQAEALCQVVEQLPAKCDTSLHEQQALLAQAEERFVALGPLPRASRHSLKRRFEQAGKQAREYLAQAERELSETAMRQLVELHHVCEMAEALAQGSLPIRERIDELHAQWDGLPKPQAHRRVLERLSARFEGALAAGDAPDPADLARTAERRERLCLDLEILRAVESPPATEALRKQRQIELLEDALQGASQDKSARIRQLQLDYLSAGAVPADRQAALDARFSRVFP